MHREKTDPFPINHGAQKRDRLSITLPYAAMSTMYKIPPGCTGGFGTRAEVNNKQLTGFMQRMLAPDASKSVSGSPYLLTVCTGAALAARAGLLDGKKATTNKVGSSVNSDLLVAISLSEASPDSALLRSRCSWKGAWAWATTQGKPGATAWQNQARWVEDGTGWTSAGVTAGKSGGHLARAASCSSNEMLREKGSLLTPYQISVTS